MINFEHVIVQRVVLLFFPVVKSQQTIPNKPINQPISVAAPTLWNTLPVSLRNADSILTFNSSLKTLILLFKLAFSF